MGHKGRQQMKLITVHCLRYRDMAPALNQMTRTIDFRTGRELKAVQHMWHRLAVLCTLVWHRSVIFGGCGVTREGKILFFEQKAVLVNQRD